MSDITTLLDERHDPPLRATYGRLLATATHVDIALSQLRLAGLDLTASETAGIQQCRVMIGRVDATMLFESDAAVFQRRAALEAFGRSGRLEMRTAPHHSWNPDFSIFRGLPGDESAVLLGAHYSEIPYPRFGIAFTGLYTGEREVQLCARRFEQLWLAGYDVLPVVLDTLARLG